MKYVFIFLALLVSIYISQWVFNHIDAWFGILLMLATAIGFGYYIINLIVKNLKK